MESFAAARSDGPPRSKSQYHREKITIFESQIEKPDQSNLGGEVIDPSMIFSTNNIAEAALLSIMNAFRTRESFRCGTCGKPSFFGAMRTIEASKTASTKQKTLW